MTAPDSLDDQPFRRLTDQQAHWLLRKTELLDERDCYGPDAPGSAAREDEITDLTRRLVESGIPEEEQPT
ncbi:hypothetical protein [Deinococcus petrolearius]|uniref:Uncharacterized protein n=1 Tax=Deinococcus petrolearius TaxID=1751295 RepID=A0ABW1DDU8_9DEIO